MNVKDIYEVKNTTVSIAGGSSTVECVFRANNAYKNVLGFGAVVREVIRTVSAGTTTERVETSSRGLKIGAREKGGQSRTILAPTPYEYIKPSELQSFTERFVPCNEVSGKDIDLVFNVELDEPVAANTESVAKEVQITFTVVYSKA